MTTTLLSVFLMFLTVSIEARNINTGLFNSPVVSAQRYERPLDSGGSFFSKSMASLFGVRHAGVGLTLRNGEEYLVHKGDRYGTNSQTVVTSASDMSSKWQAVGPPKSVQGSTVGDYVKAAGPGYNMFMDNCLKATDKMMDFL